MKPAMWQPSLAKVTVIFGRERPYHTTSPLSKAGLVAFQDISEPILAPIAMIFGFVSCLIEQISVP